jgi:putative ABC transport system permease protein
MSIWRSVRAGLRKLFRRADADRDLDDELRHYLELSISEKTRAGLSRDDAERAARIEMGGLQQSKETVRSAGWEAELETFAQDIRYAARSLRRSPAVSIAVILTLALGVGANTTMFSAVNAVMLRPLPYRDAGRVALLWTDDVKRGLHREQTAYRTITEWRERSRAFQNIAFFSRGRVTPLRDGDANARGRSLGAPVSGNLFSVLGAGALMGRTISPADEADQAPVVVISYGFWQRWFNGAPDVIGRTLSIDDPSKGGTSNLTVVGVMPPEFFFPDKQVEMWTPATTYWRFAREAVELHADWARRWTAVARLAPSTSIVDAQLEMNRIGRDLTARFPSTRPDFPGFDVTVATILDSITGMKLQSGLWLLLGATGLVLLVACANVANLLLARGALRHHEFAVRRALGGGRARLVRLLTIENLLLALVGGTIGVGGAVLATPVFGRLAASSVPRLDEISLDVRVLSFAAIATVIAALVFGAAPAFRLVRVDPFDALREGGRGTGSRRVTRLRAFVVLAECALAVLLLAGAGLLLRSLGRVNAVNPGFDPRGVLIVRVEWGPEASTAGERANPNNAEVVRARAHEESAHQLTTALRALPGATDVGFVDDFFVGGSANKSITIPGRGDQSGFEVNNGDVTPDFFSTMRVPMLRGRALTRDDAMQKIRALWAPPPTNVSFADKERLAVAEPVVINETFARRFFGGDDPIGKRFCIDPTGKTYWYVIVGVAGDMHRQGLERAAVPEYFGSYIPRPFNRADLVVRTAGDPLAIAPLVRQVIARVPGTVVASVATADAQFGAFAATRRLETSLLVAFAALALTLASVGIFGLVHYAVAERTREIGIRIALGATPADVLGAVVAQGMRMPLAGIILGLTFAVGLTRTMAHLLFNVGATDPITFATVAFVLATVAFVACYLAGRRGSRVDPVQALREF